MDKKMREDLIDVAMGRADADLVIRNANVIDVYSQSIFNTDVYIKDGMIASFKSGGKALKEIDAEGMYMAPGLIDAHCHIESSHLSPPEYSNAVVPMGTTTVIADPHEICNVTGLDGFEYMLRASENIPLSVFLMFPSCVPATPFEHSGATLLAEDAEKYIRDERVLGLGEMMNYPGVVNKDKEVMAKLALKEKWNKHIDGHAPSVSGSGLDGYISSGINTDHECETPEELREKVSKGMYVMLREGTACKNVLPLLPGVDEKNARRILFCTDDRQPGSIRDEGALNYGVTLAIRNGLDPILAITMATLNASECYHLEDRGAISPGKRADFLLLKDIKNGIYPEKVFIKGELVAEGQKISTRAKGYDSGKVTGRMNVKDFSRQKLSYKVPSDHVRIIGITPGGVVTSKKEGYIKREKDGEWVHDIEKDVLKLAVIERHHGTGNASTALIEGYGMKHGAVATTIAHDSHNIIVIGDNDDDMMLAVKKLIGIGGGITMFKDGKELMTHTLEIAGLMTNDTADEVAKTLEKMQEIAYSELGVSRAIDPFMTLSFMALPVIPSYKLTDVGLFDVDTFSFVENAL